MRAFAIALLWCAASLADDAPVSAPLSGLVFDRAAGIRPISGIPGSSALGKPLDAGMPLWRAAVSPYHDYVLAQSGEYMPPLVLRWNANGPSSYPVPGAMGRVSRIVFSPGGGAAGLYDERSGRIQIVTGLPDRPGIAQEINAASLSQPVTALAVADGAIQILVGISDGASGSVLAFGPDGGVTYSVPVGQPAALTHFSKSADAVVADGLNNTVWLIHGGQLARLAGPDDGVSGPSAVELSASQQRVIIANSGSNAVLIVDLGGKASSLVPCNCQVRGLQRLSGDAVFRLTDSADQPMWLLDGDSDTPRVVFVAQAADQGAQ